LKKEKKKGKKGRKDTKNTAAEAHASTQIETLSEVVSLDSRSSGGRFGVLDEPLEGDINAHVVLGRN